MDFEFDPELYNKSVEKNHAKALLRKPTGLKKRRRRKKFNEILYPEGKKHCLVCGKKYSVNKCNNRIKCSYCFRNKLSQQETKYCNACGKSISKMEGQDRKEWLRIRYCEGCKTKKAEAIKQINLI